MFKHGKVKIYNQTDYTLTEDMLKYKKEEIDE